MGGNANGTRQRGIRKSQEKRTVLLIWFPVTDLIYGREVQAWDVMRGSSGPGCAVRGRGNNKMTPIIAEECRSRPVSGQASMGGLARLGLQASNRPRSRL